MIADSRWGQVIEQTESDHATRYEVLRSDAVDRNARSNCYGLVVLLRQGVAAWMQAWSKLPEPAPLPVLTERQPSPLPGDTSTEVIRILVAMTLSHIQEVPA